MFLMWLWDEAELDAEQQQIAGDGVSAATVQQNSAVECCTSADGVCIAIESRWVWRTLLRQLRACNRKNVEVVNGFVLLFELRRQVVAQHRKFNGSATNVRAICLVMHSAQPALMVLPHGSLATGCARLCGATRTALPP